MFRVKNSNIAFARGESVCPEFQIVMNNGMPFVMPQINNNAGILAFTVKAGVSDEVVLAKYLDLTSIPIYSGYPDMSIGGYCKFISQEPLIFETVAEMYSAYAYSPNTSGENIIDSINTTQEKTRKRIAYCNETNYYYCWAQTSSLNGRVVLYTFEFQIPIFPEETQNLDTKEYVYDICAYMGEFKAKIEANEFPLKKVDWKIQLLKPHILLLEDSNNV